MANHTRTEKFLLEAARRFNSTLEYEELIESVLQLVASAVNSEASLVFRIDHNRSNMRIRYMNCSTDCKMQIFEQELNKGIVGWVSQFKEPVLILDAKSDERFDSEMWKDVDIDFKCVISVPLIGKGQMIGVIEAINKIDGEFNESDLDVLTGLANQIAVAIDNANLYRQAKRDVLEKNLLYEIGKKLSSSLNLNEVLKEIVDALKQAVKFTAGGVFILNPDKEEIDSVYTSGYENCSSSDLHLKFGQGLVGYVAKTGEGIIVSDVSNNEHYIDMHCNTKSEMLVPIEVDGRVIGVFNVESDILNAYDHNDLSLLSTLATSAAVSIERARLYEQLVAGQKIQQQLSIARQIQMSFLPKTDLDLADYDISGENIPSEEVGGDYYDFINIVDKQIGIAIGDVSGKGIPAALLMASFRASLIAEIRNNYSIRTICQKVNQLLFESMESGNFVTAVYGVLDAKNHIFTFANCGHNFPLHIKKNGEVKYLQEGGPVLGVSADATFEDCPIYIDVGDIIILYTDGVVEVFNDKGEEYGDKRLLKIIKNNLDKNTKEIRDLIYEDTKKFASKNHSFDDFTMIVLKRLK